MSSRCVVLVEYSVDDRHITRCAREFIFCFAYLMNTEKNEKCFAKNNFLMPHVIRNWILWNFNILSRIVCLKMSSNLFWGIVRFTKLILFPVSYALVIQETRNEKFGRDFAFFMNIFCLLLCEFWQQYDV